GALEGGEQVVDVGPLLLRSRLCAEVQDRVAATGIGELGAPFAVTAVEGQDRVAGLEAQDVAEIVGLRGRAGDSTAFGEIGVDEQALGVEIVPTHGGGTIPRNGRAA